MNHIQQIKEREYNTAGAMMGLFDLDELSNSNDINPGAVFIYMFRRFGYPRVGWDGQKTLIRYILTTQMEGVLLIVQPNATGSGTFGYELRDVIDRECYEEDIKPHQDRYARFEAWAIKNKGIETMHMCYEPDLEKLNRVWRTWKESHKPNEFESQKAAEKQFYKEQEKVTRGLLDEYLNVESFAKPLPVADRPDDSIMKQCQTALLAAIEDLHIPVMVRDVAINIRGKCGDPSDDQEIIKYSELTGVGVGNLLDEVCGV